MTLDPFILPGVPGKKNLADNLDRGALFEDEDQKAYHFRGLLPDGRWILYSVGDTPAPLMMPDPDTGFPQHPTQDQILAALANGRLNAVSSPLDAPARVLARNQEKTKTEVLTDDPYADVRMSVCRLWDKMRPALDNESLEAWRDLCFDWEAIKAKHGREKPPASTLRAWIRKRGRSGNRCWADMEDRRGQGPRSPRVTGHRLAIAVWHASSHWTARRHHSVAKLWKDVETDTDAYVRGLGMIMFDGERRWPKPDGPIDPVDKETFRGLVKRLESRHSYKTRWSAQAAQSRWEGGGGALEPTRYLEVVQQDEKEASNYFFIDTQNQVALGVATWVIAVCVRTHCVLSWDLSFDAPSRVTWMRNLLNASRFKSLPKEWATRFPALATIGGRMSCAVYDNPSWLIGQAVEDAHGDLVQDVVYAGEGQPTHKGLVERTHRTLQTLFSEELPGAKMQIALAREFNMDPSKDRLVTLAEARLAMARAICRYHTTELTGLDERTPLDVWVEEWNRWGPQHAKDQEQYARAIGDVTYDRVLDNGGVVNEHLGYSDVKTTPELMEAHALASPDRRKTKKPAFDCKVKWDPTDLSRVFVRDPMKGRYRRLPAKKKRYTAGLTLAIHKLVLRNKAAKSLLADPEGERKLLELRRLAEAEVKRISPKMAIAEQRARAAIMQQPAFRHLAGDAIELIDVAPSPTGREVVHDLGIGRVDGGRRPPRGKRGSERNQAHEDQNDADQVETDAAAYDVPAPDAGSDAAEGGLEPNGADQAPDTADDADTFDDEDDIFNSFRGY